MTRTITPRRPSPATVKRIQRQLRRDLATGPKLWEAMIAGMKWRKWRVLGFALSEMVVAGEAYGYSTWQGMHYALRPTSACPLDT